MRDYAMSQADFELTLGLVTVLESMIILNVIPNLRTIRV